MATGRLIDYLGVGLASARPADPDAYSGTLAFWFATDTGILSVWDGTDWVDLITAGGIVANEPSAGWSTGALLTYDADTGVWVEIPQGSPGDVLTANASGFPDYQTPAAGAVLSVNGMTGTVVLAMGSLDDVLEPSGGWSDAALLIYDTGSSQWVEVPPGVEGDVLTIVAGVPAWTANTGGTGIAGPSSTTDNALMRWAGTGGDMAENSGVVVSDSDEISGYKGLVDLETASSYTFVEADSGMIKELSDGTGVDAVLDRDMPKGFACTVVQAGAGTINFRPETGATLQNRQSHTDSAGQWAMCTLYVSSNAGSAAVWVLGGDTA